MIRILQILIIFILFTIEITIRFLIWIVSLTKISCSIKRMYSVKLFKHWFLKPTTHENEVEYKDPYDKIKWHICIIICTSFLFACKHEADCCYVIKYNNNQPNDTCMIHNPFINDGGELYEDARRVGINVQSVLRCNKKK